MKIFLVVLLYGLCSFSYSFESEYKSFFNNSKIDSLKCGMNIAYFLQHLEAENELNQKGYVVSIHEDYGMLNHFDARWGSREKYENGEEYKRSNWFFHVFAILNGMAADFSQAGPKVQDALEYLKLSYIPKSKTGNVFFQGKMDSESEYKKYTNMKMNLYGLDDYKRETFKSFYSGKFIELFEYLETGKGLELVRDTSSRAEITFEKRVVNSDSSVTYKGLRANYSDLSYPIEHSAFADVCPALGHFGFIPGSTEKYALDAPKEYFRVYTSLNLANEKEGKGPVAYKVSGRSSKVSAMNETWVMIGSITCTNLVDSLK